MNQPKHPEKAREAEAPKEAAKPVDVAAEVEVMASTAEFAGEIADLGIDDAESEEGGEGFKEGEKSGKAKQSSGGKNDDDGNDPHAHIRQMPPPPKMKKEIAAAIRQEIRKDEREVLLAYVGFKKIGPNKLAELVARIRELKGLLASLLDATKDMLTGMWLKWVKKTEN